METPKTAQGKLAEVIRRGMRKVAAAKTMVAFLDKVASKLPLTKATGIRSIQRDVSAGRPLAMAVKKAYPTLTGEQRGMLTSNPCSLACKHAGASCSVSGSMKAVSHKDWSVPAK